VTHPPPTAVGLPAPGSPSPANGHRQRPSAPLTAALPARSHAANSPAVLFVVRPTAASSSAVPPQSWPGLFVVRPTAASSAVRRGVGQARPRLASPAAMVGRARRVYAHHLYRGRRPGVRSRPRPLSRRESLALGRPATRDSRSAPAGRRGRRRRGRRFGITRRPAAHRCPHGGLFPSATRPSAAGTAAWALSLPPLYPVRRRRAALAPGSQSRCVTTSGPNDR
jgi:hypothetical protein